MCRKFKFCFLELSKEIFAPNIFNLRLVESTNVESADVETSDTEGQLYIFSVCHLAQKTTYVSFSSFCYVQMQLQSYVFKGSNSLSRGKTGFLGRVLGTLKMPGILDKTVVNSVVFSCANMRSDFELIIYFLPDFSILALNFSVFCREL